MFWLILKTYGLPDVLRESLMRINDIRDIFVVERPFEFMNCVVVCWFVGAHVWSI